MTNTQPLLLLPRARRHPALRAGPGVDVHRHAAPAVPVLVHPEKVKRASRGLDRSVRPRVRAHSSCCSRTLANRRRLSRLCYDATVEQLYIASIGTWTQKQGQLLGAASKCVGASQVHGVHGGAERRCCTSQGLARL